MIKLEMNGVVLNDPKEKIIDDVRHVTFITRAATRSG